jgi:hypothetical protein
LQAAHPITLSPGIIARVLRGVHIRDNRSTLQALFAAQPNLVRAFSDEDANFLAPLISTALAQAAPDQQVGFRIVQTGLPSYSQKAGAALGSSEPPLSLSPKETTAGTLYAHGRSLHLSLTLYRQRPRRPDTIGGANRYYPDPTGLDRGDVTFIPEAARRPDTYRQPGFLGQPLVTTLVIDYELLARLPEAQPEALAGTGEGAQPSSQAAGTATKPAEPKPATADDLQSMKELVIKKDMELEGLKEEMHSLRRQLEQQPESQKPKGKKKPAQRSQEPTP